LHNITRAILSYHRFYRVMTCATIKFLRPFVASIVPALPLALLTSVLLTVISFDFAVTVISLCLRQANILGAALNN